MSDAPRNLDELRAIPDMTERALAARAYVEERRGAIREALKVRDGAVIEMLRTNYGPAEVARKCRVALTTVKAIKRAYETGLGR